MDKKLEEMTVIELKALAYDLFASIQSMQNNLQVINTELQKRAKEPTKPPEIVS